MIHQYMLSLFGGLLIGTSSAVFLVTTGRVAGISGIAGAVIRRTSTRRLEDILFLLGLVLGPAAFRAATGSWPTVRVTGGYVTLLVAGLLVGFGARLGSGCTSGHGVCGLARFSPRSMVAVAVFLTTAMVTVFLMRVSGS